MKPTALILFLFGVCSVSFADSVYRCVLADGTSVFSDKSCGTATASEERLTLNADMNFDNDVPKTRRPKGLSRAKKSKKAKPMGSAKRAVRISDTHCYREDGRGRATFAARLQNRGQRKVSAWFKASLRVEGQLDSAPDWCAESKQVVLAPGQSQSVSVRCRRTVTERMHGRCRYDVAATWR